jgi:hypothetical protein
MIISRYNWERYFRWYIALALCAAVLGFATEFYFSQAAYHHPSAGRTTLFTTHGIDCWVSPPIWWVHRIGIVAFFSIFAAALIHRLAVGFAEGWNS